MSDLKSRRRLVTQVLLAVALMAGLFVAGTGTAHADPLVTINGEDELPYVVDEETLFLVEGTGFTPGLTVVIAVCNTTAGGSSGTHCDPSGWTIDVVDLNGEFDEWVHSDGTFVNFNLQTQSASGGTTTCNGLPSANGQCAIQIAQYPEFPPMGGPDFVVGCDLTF